VDAFVRRLVERLLTEGRPLSRNRHFHTFETPEGRTALRTARRLRALHRSMARCAAEGGVVELLTASSKKGERQLHDLVLRSPIGTHRAFLAPEELDLLDALPGFRDAMARSVAR
jgi:hypothetical protein